MVDIGRPFEPDYAVPPGETIAEALRERGVAPQDFAGSVGCSPAAFEDVIRGDARIDPDLANALERALGIPAAFWLTRERQFRDALARGATRLADPRAVGVAR
jgi:HTH-type transcriptional regulator/antitoxin HigA